MNKQQLLALDKNAALPLTEVQRQDPELFGQLEKKVTEQRTQTVLSSFAGASSDLQAALKRVDLGLGERPERGLSEAVLSSLQAQQVKPEVAQEAVDRLVELERSNLLQDPAEVSVPLREHPLFQAELQQAQVYRLAVPADLGDASAKVLVDRLGGPANVGEQSLTELVAEGALSEGEAKRFGVTASLYHLADERADAAEGLQRGLGNAVTQPADLARVSEGEWAAAMRRGNVRPPEGMDAKTYAGQLRKRVASVLPTDALLARVEAGEPLELVKQVRDRNPDTELLALDLTADSKEVDALDFGDLSEEERTVALGELKGYQRAFSITEDADEAAALLKGGYTSAMAVAADSKLNFQKKTGLSEVAADRHHKAASNKVGHVTTIIGTIADVYYGGFHDLGVQNLAPPVLDYLRKLPGFADLFGSQDFCKCSHCQSILGPAAYFVDLMCFASEHVLDVVFTGNRQNHVLNLKTRRPDLWTLPLTCENTDTLVPYLEMVNEILENFVAKQRNFGGDLGDRAAVEDLVYRQTLASAVNSFKLPFTLPLAKLDAYLTHFEQSRASVATALGLPANRIAAASLRLSQREFQLVTQPDETLAFHQALYGVQFNIPQGSTTIDPVDALVLPRFTGLDRQELGELIATEFVTKGIVPPPEIKPEKRDADSVQNDVERVRGMTLKVLDRIHRFTRLQRRLPWSIGETDLLLGQLGLAGLGGALDQATLRQLVPILDLHSRFRLPVDQLCALWSPIPRKGLGGRQPLFDRLFNLPTFVQADGPLPKNAVRFVHPSLRTAGVPNPDDNTLHRLLAGLQTSAEGLAELMVALAGPLGFDPAAANEDDRGFLLTAQNLGLLYRHARIAALLRLSVADLFQLITSAGLAGQVATLDDLVKLLEFHDWWKQSGFRLDDLGIATGGQVREPSRYPDPAAVTVAIVEAIASEQALNFADTVFAFVPGVTESQSRQLVAANAGAFQPSADGLALRLRATFNPAQPLTVPAGIAVPEADLKAMLLTHHASKVLPPRLATRLGLDALKTEALVRMAGVDLGGAGIVTALQGGAAAPLEDLVKKLAPLSVAFTRAVFDAQALDFIRGNGPLFGINDFNHLGMASLRKLGVYVRFADAGGEAAFTPETAPPDPAAVRAVLAAFTPAQGFAGADPDQLAAALRSDKALLATLLPNLTLPQTAPEALAMLGGCASLAAYLGVGGETLRLVVSDAYADQARAAEAVLSAFRAKYADEAEFQSKLDPFADRIRTGRRDALVAWLLRALPEEFPDADSLYAYFLLDVQMDGCRRTSRLVAAISSVQLYVHRVLMNLEQDRRPLGDPQRVHVLPERIPADEWEWRQHYRVWEANRKVFLWPENYIEPGLRDDKTPLFTELESTLLQQQINDQHVLDGYADYLGGFDELASLQIAGSFHDRAADADVLHLFGVTPSDPPVYYYRTVENALLGEVENGRGPVWSSWRKLDVQIPVRKIAPVMYLGRLFVFWTEVRTIPKNEVDEGKSRFVGYKHRITLKYTTLRLDGRWSPPQQIVLLGERFPTGDGIVEDPLADPAEKEAALKALGRGDFNEFYRQAQKMLVPRYDSRTHTEPIDDYTLTGFQWDQVYPHVMGGALKLTGRNFVMRAGVDFYRKVIQPTYYLAPRPTPVDQVLCARDEADRCTLYAGVQPWFVIDDYAQASIVADRRRILRLRDTPETTLIGLMVDMGLYKRPLLRLWGSDEVLVVNGSPADAIIDSGGDLMLLQGSVLPGPAYLLRRIGTTLGPRMSRSLFTGGVDQLLDLGTQRSLGESALPLVLLGSDVRNGSPTGRIDFTGPFGTYYREVFFHIPFLIANHLNSQQNFSAAQRWYHRIFDPTASEAISQSLPPAQQAQQERDRVWRYLEFRGLNVPKLREILSDTAAIEVYKKDPFNPHAIARLRLSAYQKCVVMKYIDNLLDWGDSLFTQFTTESVNEATMLYVTAANILGRRPAQLGSCGEAQVTPRTFEKIKPLVDKGSEFLVELETFVNVGSPWRKWRGVNKVKANLVLDREYVRFHARNLDRKLAMVPQPLPPPPPGGPVPERPPMVSPRPDLMVGPRLIDQPKVLAADLSVIPSSALALRRDPPTELAPSDAAAPSFEVRAAKALPLDADVAQPYEWKKTITGSWTSKDSKAIRYADDDRPRIRGFDRVPGFTKAFVRQVIPVFCIPQNPDLLAYWDQVEDRLFKIRHCMDIAGVRRELALFAPEIDPRLLVRARAAGLSISEALGATSGDLPPYRFTYLIEKARQHVAAVQAFGAGLLSALEKKDLEELNRLRTVHQQHLLKMTSKVRDWEVETAQRAIETVQRQQDAVTFRRDYYQGLIDGGLSPWETVQQVSRHTATVSYIATALLRGTAGILSLLPQLGSPFAMKYGGVELGSSADRWSKVLDDTGKIAEIVSASAGLEAGFQRREEGWEYQVDLAQKELDQLEKQADSGQLRFQVAVRSRELHQRSIEQLEEVFALYGSRFTNLDLYTFMATTMQRLYREAYNGAYAMARLAEQAYRFERDDEATPLLQPTHWEADRGGLLAGERLLADLNNLERRFMETNARTLELDQAFSLAQLDPDALLELRESGTCEFSLPEVAFDLTYPGQFRRRIRSARLTIPCVTGPYTNVGATLTLTASQLRKEPKLGDQNLLDVPIRRSVSVSTSTAQNDAGVLEFSFRDERYMPFEGAGAISSWRLTLPANFRQFDYQTINDVILHLSYTAEEDSLLRQQVEKLDANLEGAILNYLANNPLTRVLSLRQDFSSAYNRLLASPANTPVKVRLTDKYLPIFLRGRNIQVTKAKLLLRTPVAQTVGGVQITVNGTPQAGFAKDPDLGNLWFKDVTAALAAGLLREHTLTVAAAGDLAPDPSPNGAALDDQKLLDMYLHVDYQLT